MLVLLVLSLALSQIHGELTIKPSQTLLTRDQHKSFIALCTDQSESRTFLWRSPQQKDVPENIFERVTVERQTNGIRLRIRNLTIDDQGTWECIGTNENGEQTKKTLQMTVKVPITFHGDSMQYVPFGESFTIKCYVQANPIAEVSWFRGQDKLRIENPNYEVAHDGLHIKQVNMSDNDIFWCRGDVLETGESRDYPISVIVSKPISETRITCVNPCAIEKKTATLTCEASGLPSPRYSWFYGSVDELRPVKESPVGASEVPKFVVRGNQLTINYVDETDNGKYSCQAFNEFDRKGQRAEYNLNVIVPPRLSLIPPIEINLDSQHAQRVSFQCRVERGSSNSLALEWQYINHTSIQPTNGILIDKTQYETHKLIELRFDPVHREHFGNYSCVAKNLADSTYATASLLIQFQPVYTGPNTNIVTTIPNYRSIMRCQFESYPSPQMQWIKLSRTIQDPQGRILAVGIDNGVNDITTKQIGTTLYESVLSYTPTEADFGLSFECRALNPRIGRHSFTLQRAQPPKKINITHVKPSSSGVEIFFQSSETDDLPVLQYILKYDIQDTKESQLQTLIIPAQKSTKQIRIENLRPSTNYQLLIVAESRAGIGQQTGPIQFRTLDRQIPDFTIDENINRTCLSDESCLITWNIESDGGAPILRTEILYALAKDDSGLDIDGAISTPISIDSSTTEYELTGLKPGTKYVVIIKLYNEVGVAEQKFRIKTNQESNEYNTMRRNSLITDDRKTQPNKWIIIAIIIAIIFSAVIVVTVCVLLRLFRLDAKHETTNSDHQTTPMMNGDHQSDKTNVYTNGHSLSTKYKKSKSTCRRICVDDDSV
ncbi:unnamed protein product [Rotaria magnacalcarata]|uniref:Uncharacterized protein n=7 Tax=Rotaria magnacalcarata TaxID=392030 RepID=A0A819NWF3_9BILA|nr:unnamed protein product [Rotaria magnacalcarata]CAF2118410.1 unnamed protein product [Rotaria magnacalcarata]CAF3946329.1 unnamed protein product [Rotaria magnacalcarata]CAF4004165.1 unnamed protein product [Rotaria magnacalcarata]